MKRGDVYEDREGKRLIILDVNDIGGCHARFPTGRVLYVPVATLQRIARKVDEVTGPDLETLDRP